ncbi:hypothetical protein D3C71_1463820 [compost metagenome]
MSVNKESLEEAMNYCLSYGVTYKGDYFKTLSDLCSAKGVLYLNVKARLTLGWSLEDAITRPLEKGGGSVCKYKGIQYRSKAELCREYKISPSIVNGFLKLNKDVDWLNAFELLESFINTLPGNRPDIITRLPFIIYDNVWYSKLVDFLSSCGVNEMQYRHVKDKYKINDIKVIMMKMLEELTPVIITKDGIRGYSDIRKKTKSAIPTLIKNGHVNVTPERSYPSCTFDSRLQFMDCLYKFRDYKESFLRGGN